jgi:membrane protease YdiL (CAAX protease family)
VETIDPHQPESSAAATDETDATFVWPPLPVTDPVSVPSAPRPFQWENPGWGFPTALLVWGGSVCLLFIMSLAFGLPYMLRLMNTGKSAEEVQALLLQNPKFLVWQIVAALPAHALTLLLVWAVVTRWGKRPFWREVSWGWGDIRNLYAIAAGFLSAFVLFYVSAKLLSKIGGGETMIDKLVDSSRTARLVLAFIAAATAPLVEELVYRGLLYPAAQRGVARIGRVMLPSPGQQDSLQIGSAIIAVLLISALFAGVHVAQYRNSLGVIAAISLLSLTLTASRAITGRVLPGFIIHLVFNGVQSLGLVFFDKINKKPPPVAPTVALMLDLLHRLPLLY